LICAYSVAFFVAGKKKVDCGFYGIRIILGEKIEVEIFLRFR